MKVRWLAVSLFLFVTVLFGSEGKKRVSNLFSLQDEPVEMAVCDLSRGTIYQCSYREGSGFYIVDSVIVEFRSVTPGFYHLREDENNSIVLVSRYPGEIVCREVLVCVENARERCPFIVTDSTYLDKLRDFFSLSEGEVVVVDSLCYGGEIDYREKLSKWKFFFEDYLDFKRSKDVKKIDKVYSTYYRSNGGRDIQFLKKMIALEKSLDGWVKLECEAPVAIEDGNFAYIYFKQRMFTGKKMEFARKFLTLIKEARGWRIVYDGTDIEKMEYMRDTIESFVNRWREAWESLDIKRYGKFYSQSFKSDGMDLEEWLSRKEKLFKRLKWVKVEVENLSVLSTERMLWRVEFLQHYTSDKSRDTGYKILFIEGIPEEFKIVKEIWVPVAR